MSTPAAGDLKPARLRLWSNWLWILAAILGAAVLWSSARLIHDQRLRREALRSLAEDKATEIANLGAAKFNLLVAEAFGPSWLEPGDAQGFVARLDAHQRDRTSCRCRETLPISRFFRFDASSSAPFSASSERLSSGTGDPAAAIADSTLVRIGHEQFEEGIQHSAPVTNVEIIGNQAVVTVTRPAGAGPRTKVFGAIMPLAGLASALFAAFPRDMPDGTRRGPVVITHAAHDSMAAVHAEHVERHQRLVRLDTLGLGVAVGQQAIFGAVADRPYVGTATLPPPLQALKVSVALVSSQVSLGVLMPPAHDRLWWNGVLILATIVVCVFAIGSSRREVALARARSDFIAGISHDLRMPLAQILLASETLSLGRERTENERSSLNASILREARRLKAMVDNVLLFTRSGAVGIQPRLQAVDVAMMFRSVAESVELGLLDAGQRIETDVSDDVRLIADRGLLHQALVNLVDNAMKYGPTGQRIRLSAAAESRVVKITVEDQGPGIPVGARARLFEPYERLDRDSTSERTGSGLGLAVVRQIVLACGGEVAIEDAPVGTRVVIRLPIAA